GIPPSNNTGMKPSIKFHYNARFIVKIRPESPNPRWRIRLRKIHRVSGFGPLREPPQSLIQRLRPPTAEQFAEAEASSRSFSSLSGRARLSAYRIRTASVPGSLRAPVRPLAANGRFLD